MFKKFIFITTLAVFLASNSAFSALTAKEKTVIEKLNDACAGNGSGSDYANYSIEDFDGAEAAKNLKIEGCSDSEYSSSKEAGIKLALRTVTRDSYVTGNECVYRYLTKSDRSVLRSLIKSSKNKAVFTGLIGDSENSEGCSITLVNLYRYDGIKISIEFNETD